MDYQLEMKFKRSKGRKGLKIFFGKKDEKNTLVWEFGGWDNYDSIISMTTNGCGSCISHRIFHVEDIEYTLKLIVKGQKIEAYINGEFFNEAYAKAPVLEELYVAVSKEKETKDLIIKAVNLAEEDKETKLFLLGTNIAEYACERYEMAGYSLDAMNSFEEPEKVAPVQTSIKLKNTDCITFKGHSLTVIRMKNAMQ